MWIRALFGEIFLQFTPFTFQKHSTYLKVDPFCTTHTTRMSKKPKEVQTLRLVRKMLTMIKLYESSDWLTVDTPSMKRRMAVLIKGPVRQITASSSLLLNSHIYLKTNHIFNAVIIIKLNSIQHTICTLKKKKKFKSLKHKPK